MTFARRRRREGLDLRLALPVAGAGQLQQRLCARAVSARAQCIPQTQPARQGKSAKPSQLIPPVLPLFTRFRPYLAHFFPVFSRFLRVFTAWPRRFQQAPSRDPGPRNGGKGTKSGELRPSFDAPDANQRINWQFGEICGVNIPNQAAEHYYLITEPMDAVSRHSYRWHLGCILLKMPAISLLTGRPGVARRRRPG